MQPTEDRTEVERRLAMPLAEAMRTQRSVRRLSDEPVDDAVLRPLLELALKAPSGGNRQPQEFVVVRDRAVKERLAALNRQSWAVLRAVYSRRAETESQLRIIAAVDWQAERFADVPVVVVVCSARRIVPFPPIAATSLYGSVYPSVQNLLLAARAVGLGAGLITLPLWSTVRARRALGLPWRVQPVAVVPLGWPLGRYGPTTRKPLGDVTHLDRYGNRLS
jgi:nitroreductase